MQIEYYDSITKQQVKCILFDSTLFHILAREPLTEFHIPKQVTFHHTWRMYEEQAELQAIYAHEESAEYETFDGALYNRRNHTLLYVPKGKRSLRIPVWAEAVGYRALSGCRLDTITVDPGNEHFGMKDGMLYSGDLTRLYDIPAGSSELYITPSVTYIDETVLCRVFSKVEVHPDNPVYTAVEGVLFRGNAIVYVCPLTEKIHIPGNISNISKLDQARCLKEITAAADHPCCRVIGNIIYSRDCTVLHHIPQCAEHADFPNQLRMLRAGDLEDHPKLKWVSFHANTEIARHTFAGLNEDCRIGVRLPGAGTVELPNGNPQALAGCMGFLRGGEPEVKQGTEAFYLDLYLLKWKEDPAFDRVMKVSSWQIIRCLIGKNDIRRMKALLADGRLITRKNIGKAMGLAACGHMEMYALLEDHKEQMKATHL